MRDVVVIGGGLAGAAAACHLARAGRDVLLLERTTGPHDKVCGEFLSFEAQEELAHLNIDLRALGAVPIRRVAVQRGSVRSTARLPFEALSLSRRVLDEALLARAAALGAEVRRGARVKRLARAGSVWAVGTDQSPDHMACHVVLATGKHDLRGWRRRAGWQNDLLGFKAYLPDTGASSPGDAVELHLFPGGYAGLERVEGQRSNLCLLIRQETFAALGGRWEAVLGSISEPGSGLATMAATPEGRRTRPKAVHGVPYGFVQDRSDGTWRIGDQAAVIPSFTGMGMSIALHSARLAARHIIEGQGPDHFQRRLAHDLRWQIRRSTLVSLGLVARPSQALASHLLHPWLLRGMVHATRIPHAARREL